MFIVVQYPQDKGVSDPMLQADCHDGGNRQPSAHLRRGGAGLPCACVCECVLVRGGAAVSAMTSDWCVLTSAERSGERGRTRRAYLISRAQERTARSDTEM